jgi:hypothetical protein
MDRRKALKMWHFTGTALSSSTIGFYLKALLSKNHVFQKNTGFDR